MIVVRVELWPSSDPRQVQTLALARICNDGTGGQELGHYDVELLNTVNLKTWRRARVENHPRKRQSVWRLVQKALNAAMPALKAAGDRRQKELQL